MKRGLHGAVAMLLVMLLLITSMPMAALAEIVKVDTSSGIQPFSILPGDTEVLTYEFYVGEKLVDTQRVGDGETLVAPKTPTQDGHKFMGWTENPDDSNPTYQSFETSINVTETKTIKLYAHFEEVYYVFFMDDDGRVYETRWGTSGDPIEADVTFPVGSDEAITGWYDNRECEGEKVEFVVLDHSNVTLYPNVEQGAWLTFDSAGGTYIEPVFVAPGQTTSQPEVPTRAGYNFAGWYQGETKFEFGSGIEENTTLTARWTARNDTPYTVIYWIENADDQGYAYEGSKTLRGTTGTSIQLLNNNDGYGSNNLDSEHRNYFTFKEYDQGKTIAGDGSTVVNVYYARNTYTLTFRARVDSGFPWWSDYETVATITAKWNAYIADEFDKPPFNTTYNGRAWEDTGNTYDYALQTLDRMPGANVTFNLYNRSSDTLKTINYYVQTVDSEDNSQSWPSTPGNDYELLKRVRTYFRYATYEEEYHEIEGFTRFSRTAAGFDHDNRKNFRNNQLDLYYKRNSYKIEFRNVNGVEEERTFKYEADLTGAFDWTPNRPDGIEESYTFGGWYTSPECVAGTEASANLQKMPAGDQVVYAKWSAPTFTVTVHDINGNVSEAISVDYGGDVSTDAMPPITPPEGSTFRGWCTREPNGDGTYLYTPFNFSTKIYRDYDLYPYITSNAAFHVTYDAGKGTGEVEDSTNYAQYSYADVKSGAELEPPVGQVFLYWQVEGSDTKYYPNDKIYITGDVELIAIYGPTPEGTNITYVLNYPGAETQQKSISLINNAAHTVLNWNDSELSFGVTVDGYEFVGWSTTRHDPADDIDSKVNYPVGTEIIVNKDNAAEANILYGCWKPKKGTLVIEKILPEAGGGGKQFTFKVRKQGSDKVFDTVTVIVDDKTGSQTITLPEGMYTVREVLDKNQDYIVNPEQEQTAKIEKNKTTVVKFTNTLPKYDVTIKKKVTGNMYNTNDEFAFEATVTFNDKSYKISDGAGYSVDPDTNKITFRLKGNESVVLKGVPKYATVTVTETDGKDYTTSYQAGNAEKTDGEKAEITVWGESSVTFINDKTITIDTGVNLDVLPYLLMLAVAGGAVALLLVLKRRKTQE